jgi:hypothetical protein
MRRPGGHGLGARVAGAEVDDVGDEQLCPGLEGAPTTYESGADVDPAGGRQASNSQCFLSSSWIADTSLSAECRHALPAAWGSHGIRLKPDATRDSQHS